MTDPLITGQRTNEHGQPVGLPLAQTADCPHPKRAPMAGRYCRLDPLDPAHAGALHAAFAEDRSGALWTYMPHGPFDSTAALRDWIARAAAGDDPLFFAVMVDGAPLGLASYLRIKPAARSLETGWITFAPRLQATRAATEAHYLMMARAFALGYRRYEWKCDALNATSRRAAARLGFTYEGTFRKATHYKGRNRDTAWFSVIDSDWPAVRARFEAWLDPANFTAAGAQRGRLGGAASTQRDRARSTERPPR